MSTRAPVHGSQRRFRRTRRLLGIAWMLTVAAFIFYAAVLRPLVERVARGALEDLGMGPVALDVRSVTLDGAEIGGLDLGDGARVRAGHVSLRYGLSGLLEKRLDVIEIVGGSLEVRYVDGTWDLGPFSKLPKGGDRLPFDRLELSEVRWIVEAKGRRVAGVVSGVISVRGRRALDLRLDLSMLDASASLSGTIDLETQSVDVRLAGEMRRIEAWIDLVTTNSAARIPGRFRGAASYEAWVQTKEGEPRVWAHLATQGSSWSGVVADQRVTADLSMELDIPAVGREPVPLGDDFRIRLSAADVRASGPQALSADIDATMTNGRELHVTASFGPDGRPADERVSVHAKVTNPFDAAAYDVTVAAELAPNVLMSYGEFWDRHSARFLERVSADLTMNVRGSMPTSTEPKPVARFAGGVAIRADTELPKVLLERLALAGVVLAPESTASASWKASGTIQGAESYAITLDSGDLRLNVPSVGHELATLHAARLRSSFRATLTREEASLTITRDSALELGGVTTEAGHLSSTTVPLTLRISEPMVLVVARGASIAAWKIQETAAQLDLTSGSWTSRDGRMQCEGLSARLHPRIVGDSEALTIELAAGDHVALLGPLRWTDAWTIDRSDTPLIGATLEGTTRASVGPTRSWSASALRLFANIPRFEPRQDVTVEGLSASWILALAGDATKQVARAEEPGSLSVQRITSAVRGVAVQATGTNVVLTTGPESLLVRSGGDTRAHVRWELPRAIALTGDAGLSGNLERWSGEAVFASTTGLRATTAGVLDVERRNPDEPRSVWSAKALELTIAAAMTTGSEGPSDLEIGLTAVLGVGGGIRIAEPRSEILIPTMQVRARAESTADSNSFDGAVTIGGAELWYGDAKLTVSDISATVPFTVGRPLTESGQFRLPTIWRGDDLLPEASGTLAYDDGCVRATGEWQLLEGVVAKIEAQIDLRPRVPEGSIAVRIPRFTITSVNQPARIFGALEGAQMGGSMELDAVIAIRGPRVEPTITLTLDDVSLRSEAWDASVEGIGARVLVNGFSPWSTPGRQILRISKAHLGKLNVESGEMAFRLESPDSLFVERLAVGWVGGHLRLHALRLDPKHPVLEGEVFADDLDLALLLETVAKERARGSGRLYGRLPVRIDWPEITYSDGYLYGAPGLGHLEILDAGSLLDQVPASARSALTDFEFSVLETHFVNDGARGDATLRLRGKGRADGSRQEVLLDVNLSGFDQLLAGAIMIQRAGGRFDF